MKRTYLFFLTAFLLFSCNETSTNLDVKLTQRQSPPVKIIADSIEIEGDLGAFNKTIKSQELEPGLQIVTISFEAEKPSSFNPLTIKFKFPSVDINGYWNPTFDGNFNYWRSGYTSRASRWAPILSYYNNALNNRITFALSDALNKVDVNCYIKEEDVHFYPKFRLFSQKMPLTTSYEVQLRIDTRSIPYYQSVNEVAEWWAGMEEYKPSNVPDIAKRPMYSTWYSYHQNITAEKMIEECKISKSLGCEAIIVDDGWQTLDSNRGYAYTGDWIPERVPQMKTFVDSVHAIGMKILLWYSLPFMGENAENYDRFKGKYLRYWDGQGTYVLDPRYPEVREYIIQTYEKALQNWNLDGFKLDFIGRFSSDDKTILTKENGRDFASVNEATDFLMTEVMRRLVEVRPDIMIEFRQPYIGPLMRKYGNMFRGVDCPNNAVSNRIEITNLRLLSGNTAVHSDMFIWRKEEPVESAALQILNILYSVPQLSVRLEEIPKRHLKMIENWFGYWNQNRHILLDGKFIPSNPVANYPVLSAYDEVKQITTLFENQIVEIENQGVQKIDIINAKASTSVLLKMEESKASQITIFDCEGLEALETTDFDLKKGIQEFQVPQSGRIEISW